MNTKICIFIIFFTQLGYAQIGGDYAFASLDLAQSARSTALNGGTIATMDEDVTFAYANPALLNTKMHGQFSLNQQFHFADINHGFANMGFGIG